MRRFSDLYKMLLIFVLVTGTATLPSPGSSVTGGEVTKTRDIKGIEVSHFSGSVDWQKVKTGGYTFAFAKSSEGVDLKDPAFQDHWQEIKKTGLIRGAYHFFVTEDDPKGWKEWHLWQWKENAAVPGVEKGADLRIFNHKEKDFSSLLLKKKRKNAKNEKTIRG